MASRFRAKLNVVAVLLLGASLALVGGCRHGRDRNVLQSNPDVLYRLAHDSLESGDFSRAIASYEALEARFPFSAAARQGRLDLMYAYYKSNQPEQAVDAADTFIRENPTHPRADYAHYIKGMVFYERAPRGFGSLFNADAGQRPPSEARKAFASFQTVVQQFPKSEYAHDARKRMISLRNRLADYEVSVARYYVRRAAWVGALARVKYAIENYDGAPAIREAVQLMAQSYRALGMTQLAEQTDRMYQANFAGTEEPSKRKKNKSWWKFWS